MRRTLHGGQRGAPPLASGQIRQGESLNRSCIVLLSAILQVFVEGVFERESKHTFSRLLAPTVWDSYWKQIGRPGNPSDENIKKLFLRIGIPDVFVGLSWQGTNTTKIKQNLKLLNELRNGIAHGRSVLRSNNRRYGLTLAEVVRLRDFAEHFGQRFEHHVQSFR